MIEDKNLKVSFITRDTRDTMETSNIQPISHKKNQLEILDDSSDQSLIEEDYSVTFKAICEYAPSYYFNSVPLMFNRMNPYLLNMISLVFIAFFGNATYTAAFGLGNAIFMFFWQTFTQVNGETQGINCSKAFGAQDFKAMRLHFYRGFIWNILITLLSCVLYTNIDTILIASGFQPEMTRLAKQMVVSLLPALFFQTVNEMIRNYMMSQKITKPFIWINLASFAFFPVGGYFIIYKTGWGVPGFGLFKLIVEIINMCGLIILMKKYGHKQQLGRESFKDIFECKAYAQYMRDFGKILMGWYASYFGLEVNTILCGLTKDTVIMACWVSYMNLFAIVWTIGAGLAITTRTACGCAIGENKPLKAKKYGTIGFILALCYSCVGGTLIMCLRNFIAKMFSEVPAVLEQLDLQILLMGVLALFVGTGATVATMFRVIDKAGLYSIVMLINQVGVNTTLAILSLFYWGLGAHGVGYAFLISWGSTFFFTAWYVMLKFNWRSLQKP